jgi:hypothetical protein
MFINMFRDTLQLYSLLSQMNPLHIFSSHQSPLLSNIYFPSSVQNKILYTFIIFPINATCNAHQNLTIVIILIIILYFGVA